MPGYVSIPLVKYLLAFLLGVTLIFWLTLGLPDATYAITGTYASTETQRLLRIELGLNGTAWDQFLAYWTGIFSGSMRSFYTREPLIEVLPIKLGISLLLLVLTLVAEIMLTAIWVLAFRLLHRAPVLRNFLVSWTASVPIFVSAIFFLYLSTVLGFPPLLGAAASLALFPSLVLGTNIYQRWISLRRTPYYILELHYRIRPGAMIGRRFLEFLPSLTIVFNSVAFFFATGLAVVEWMFGLPGFGRWTLDAILRLDLPVIFLVGTVTTLFVSACLMCEEMLRRRFSIRHQE